ncbi:MAG: GNAT family N-acetyltransferase [Thermoplasmata archaeon]|nr:GNAT family N-acetyltransferase [Thermoplasmata archaeon]
MQVVKFEDKLYKDLEEFWLAIGEPQQSLSGFLTSENYLKDSHLLALENEKIVGSAFLMEFDRIYFVLRYLPEHKNAASELFEKLCVYARTRGIKEMCCWLSSDKHPVTELLQQFPLARAEKYYRMGCVISQRSVMPDNVRILESAESENVKQVVFDAFSDTGEREMIERTLKGAIPVEKSVFLGCFEGNVLCGCVLIIGYPNDKAKAYIPVIAVKKELQRRGYGRRLIEGAIAWASDNGVEELTLSVKTDNLPAIRLYSRTGFRVNDEVEIYCIKCG